MTDPQLHDRLHRAADPIDVAPEARLQSLRVHAHARTVRRRVAGLAVGVVVAVLAAAVALQMRSGGAPVGVNVPGAGPELTGTIAYFSLDGTAATMSVRDRTFGGADTQLVAQTDTLGVSYSPDGARLAYVQGPDGGFAIMVANADGSDAHEVGQDVGGEAQAVSWAPDSSRLAVLTFASDGSGTHVRILDLATGEFTDLPRGDGYTWSRLAWSPDGSEIALDGNPLKPDGTPGLYLLPVDGGKLVSLKTNVTTEYMDWSPDGSQLVFSIRNVPWPADSGDYGWDIATIDADGSGFRQLTDVPTWENFPVWSPDGRWIAFSSDRDASQSQLEANASPDATTFGGVGIYVMQPDGTDVQPVMPAEDGHAFAPVDWRA
jgi:Tol biopolymer transport system component